MVSPELKNSPSFKKIVWKIGNFNLLVHQLLILRYQINPLFSRQSKTSLRYFLQGAPFESGQEDLSLLLSQVQSSQLSGMKEQTTLVSSAILNSPFCSTFFINDWVICIISSLLFLYLIVLRNIEARWKVSLCGEYLFNFIKQISQGLRQLRLTFCSKR